MRVGVAWSPGTEAPAFPVPPDAPWPGLLIFQRLPPQNVAADQIGAAELRWSVRGPTALNGMRSQTGKRGPQAVFLNAEPRAARPVTTPCPVSNRLQESSLQEN
jgi:hypothetical protein